MSRKGCVLYMIQIDGNSCLNQRYKKSECNRCRIACPSKCIQEDLKVNSNDCNDCGICLSVCPAEAISSSEVSSKDLQELITADESCLVLSCRLRDKQSSWRCLGFIDIRLIFSLILSGAKKNRQIVIKNQLCNTCKPQVGKYLNELFHEANKILILAGKNPIIQGFNSDSIRMHETLISRRNLFKSIIRKGAKFLSESLDEEKNFGRQSRQMLFSQYESSIDIPIMEPTALFNAISYSDSCNACASCEKICPQNAIKIKEQGEKLEFYHNSRVCSGCEICIVNCPQEAITLKFATYLGIYKVAEHKLPRCVQCGNLYMPIANQEICIQCMLKNPLKIDWL